MPISVWADVGGTFTDCIIHDSLGRRETKVLSSGLIRAAVDSIIGHHAIKLTSIACADTDQFWRGASVSAIHRDGSATPLGTIASQLGETISLEDPIPASIRGGGLNAVEIDAHLEAPVLAVRLLLRLPLNQPLPPTEVRMGTTRGTNALLTRQGAKTALLITRGFADILRIGEQDRPDLFSLVITKPAPLTEQVVEVTERLDANGKVLAPIDQASLRHDLQNLKHQGVESLAICFLHSHVNDVHERQTFQLAQQAGFSSISLSSDVAPLIKLVSRAETTTLDAYLNPVLSGYIDKVWHQFGGERNCHLRLMTSAGNLVQPKTFRGCDSILSGPAGGIVALGHVAQLANADQAIGLDMGGTSTDVSRFVGRVGRRYESRVAGVRLMSPMMDIETIAAGGGSICDVSDDGRMIVGPASAGADPGPASYGRGGPLTVTDINLLLGRISEQRFPFRLQVQSAKDKLAQVRQRLPDANRFSSDQELSEGFLSIAIAHMAEAVRNVSTAQGTDVRKMTLVGFGGAAGQHVCRVAQSLGINRIIDHPDAGLMSALGMGLASVGRIITHGVYQPLSDLSPAMIDQIAQELKTQAKALMESEHADAATLNFDFQSDLRYAGTDSTLSLDLEPLATLSERFHASHLQTFGYNQTERPIEVVAIRCEVTVPTRSLEDGTDGPFQSVADQTVRIWNHGQWIDASYLVRETIRAGTTIPAPAMIVGRHGTLLVEPGWQAKRIHHGIIELTPVEFPSSTMTDGSPLDQADDPVLLEVVARRLQGIADGMGEVLRRTAISVNIKERRDYSCAIFRRDGALVANAPHVPVHLGAMGHTVRHLIETFPAMVPGDCFLSNDPFTGGSHLPDLTVVTPIFCQHQSAPAFFVASRAHHAEIGGRTPGSMPPDATTLAEEGVLIRDFSLVRSGRTRINELRALLSSGPFPSRSVQENLADVAAQQAAGAHGAAAIGELTKVHSPELIEALMSKLLTVAADSMQRWINTLSEQPMQFLDSLDDGSPIGVTIQRNGQRLSIDFNTGGVHPRGFNATPAIVTAAVMYVLRTCSGSDLPLCDGVISNVDINIPAGLLNPPANSDPQKCAAVVAGNVETSQRIVDVLLGALGVAAASQGTMNNVLMGDETFGYYETIGGGSGATSGADGADAVHTHMTNTRITDPEVLESRLPVRLHRFAIRRGSGGAGLHRGGDGMIREFEFFKPLVVSLLTGRRTQPPYGASGGESGQCGRNTLIRNNQTIELPPTATINVDRGDRLIIETPGGGGWGTLAD